jgi:hypothetical protein
VAGVALSATDTCSAGPAFTRNMGDPYPTILPTTRECY